MPAASVSGSPGVSGALWAQLQQQQAQRTAEQAEQRARSLQQQARSAQSDADRAQEKARSLQDSIRPLRNCFAFGNPNTIIKTATRLIGQPVGLCRAPFRFVSDEGVAALKKVLHTA